MSKIGIIGAMELEVATLKKIWIQTRLQRKPVWNSMRVI